MTRLLALLLRLLILLSAVPMMGSDCDVSIDDGGIEIDNDNDDFEDWLDDLFD